MPVLEGVLVYSVGNEISKMSSFSGCFFRFFIPSEPSASLSHVKKRGEGRKGNSLFCVNKGREENR